ncbi:hypothetical protein HYV86_00520 [Candidatus Woesearchaeota archaeon]|nr:hypothetical protein [Candidatus Woesearchaeota archaeon]
MKNTITPPIFAALAMLSASCAEYHSFHEEDDNSAANGEVPIDVGSFPCYVPLRNPPSPNFYFEGTTNEGYGKTKEERTNWKHNQGVNPYEQVNCVVTNPIAREYDANFTYTGNTLDLSDTQQLDRPEVIGISWFLDSLKPEDFAEKKGYNNPAVGYPQPTAGIYGDTLVAHVGNCYFESAGVRLGNVQDNGGWIFAPNREEGKLGRVMPIMSPQQNQTAIRTNAGFPDISDCFSQTTRE